MRLGDSGGKNRSLILSITWDWPFRLFQTTIVSSISTQKMPVEEIRMLRTLIKILALPLALVITMGGPMGRPCLAQPAADKAQPVEKTTLAYDQPGPFKVYEIEGAWKDNRVNHLVPFLIRYPKDAPGRLPIVIFSHGLGGSKEGAAYYSEHLASHGYVVVNLQHQGSDISIWGGQRPDLENLKITPLIRNAMSPQSALDRFQDVYLAVYALHSLDHQPGALKDRLDLDHIGMSGHSYGALTTQAMAGQIFPRGQSMGHPEFKAFLAMSPSSAANGRDGEAFGAISRPFLSMTGTQDGFNLNGKSNYALERQKPYQAMKRAPSVLLVLNGGDHMVFSGRQELGLSRPMDGRFRQLIKAASLAFWDATLKDNAEARAWLIGPGMAALAGSDAQIQSRNMER